MEKELEEELAKALEEELAKGLEKELAKGLEEELAEALEEELAKGLEKELAKGLEVWAKALEWLLPEGARGSCKDSFVWREFWYVSKSSAVINRI